MKDQSKSMRGRSVRSRILTISDKIILAVLALLVAVFILYPMICILLRSFQQEGSFSLAAWQDKGDRTLRLLWNSVYVAFLAGVLSTALSIGVATFVSFAGRRLKNVLSAFLLITMVSPPFVTSLAYIQLFGRRGSITHGLLGLSVNPYGWKGVVVMQTVYFASLNALLLMGLLERVDGNLLQASKDLGAKNASTYRNIVLPLIRPAVAVCFLLSFIRSLADYGTPVVIGGRYENLSTEIYMQVVGYSNLERSAALNVILLLPAVIVFIMYRRLMKKSDQQLGSEDTNEEIAKSAYRPGGITGLMIILSSLLFFIMMILQYGSIFLNSITKQIKGKRVFSLEPFRALMERSSDTFIRSICYALIVAVCGTIFGVMVSYYVERRHVRFGGFLDFLVTLPYMIPGSCFGIGYILAFNSTPLKLTGTAAIVILNMIFKQLSITTKVTSATFAQLPPELDMAAGDLGAEKLQVLKDVILPNLKNAFAVGFINNFTSAMVTAGAVIFLVTPGQKIAVFTLFDAINTGKYAEASMISTVLILCTVVVNLLFVRTAGRRKGGTIIVS